MEETRILKHSTLLAILILINAMLLIVAKSEVYTVRDDDEWNTGANYLKWTENLISP